MTITTFFAETEDTAREFKSFTDAVRELTADWTDEEIVGTWSIEEVFEGLRPEDGMPDVRFRTWTPQIDSDPVVGDCLVWVTKGWV